MSVKGSSEGSPKKVGEDGVYYEMWSKFSLDKVMEGATRISKTLESKKDLQVRQNELEIAKLNQIIDMHKQSPISLIL